MDEIQSFLTCYRAVVRGYQLPPMASDRVLDRILGRIGRSASAGSPPQAVPSIIRTPSKGGQANENRTSE